MKLPIITILILSAVTLSCLNHYKNVENSKSDYQIIPKPLRLETKNGRFLIDPSTRIVVDKTLKNEGEYLNSLLRLSKEIEISPVNDDNEGVIQLQLDPNIETEEEYFLTVDYKTILIKGKTPKGVFYGIQSLRQLMPVSIEVGRTDNSEITIPAVSIHDKPRFGYRGMHLDVARHFFSPQHIKKYIDLIALHKMNTFHWHLTEDQGWRIEIKKYPKLTEIGAWRKETLIGHIRDIPHKYDGVRYGGFYTQEEIKDIVEYAQKRHVTIIPEIELPGHALAALASYPELGIPNKKYEVATKWGVFNDIYEPTETTFKFLEDVLTEVIELFPSRFIHIGGDEAPKDQWIASQVAQDLIKKENLKDEHELQSYFIRRIELFLNSKGKDIIGWDEILEGGLAPNATVMSWRGAKGGIEAAKQKHKVIMTPNHTCYFNFYQSENKENEPLAIRGLTTVEDVYAYNPIPEELSDEEEKYILGAQGNIWTEYINTIDLLEYMALPRMSALSETLWTPKELKNIDDFKENLISLSKRFDVLGYNYATHIFND